MALVLLAIAAGVVIGYARGGRARHLLKQRPLRSRLLLTALALYVLGVLGGWAWEPLLPTLTALSGLVLGYFAWLNRHFEGAALIALGLTSNALVVMVNGATPISASATGRAGAAAVDLADSRYMPVADAVLPWLGKVVPVALPAAPEVVSPGDIALAAGAGLVIVTCMGARRRMVKRHTAAITAQEDEPEDAGNRPGEPATAVPESSASMASVPVAHNEATSPPQQAGTG